MIPVFGKPKEQLTQQQKGFTSYINGILEAEQEQDWIILHVVVPRTSQQCYWFPLMSSLQQLSLIYSWSSRS